LPIPAIDGQAADQILRSLNDLTIGQRGEIMRLSSDPATQAFLTAEGLRPGLEVEALAIGSGGAMLLAAGDKRLHLAASVAGEVLISIKRDPRLEE
jgi:hypothetical protein